jgi:hypothetical protein
MADDLKSVIDFDLIRSSSLHLGRPIRSALIHY